jgi:predicted short-subunit dehydrogenase-like oxidoreductase (DUF2520 family)
VNVAAPGRVRIVGRGRAGGSFAGALTRLGWDVDVRPGRDPDRFDELDGVGTVLLCVPDAAVAAVASSWPGGEGTVLAHCAGSLTLDVLEPAARRASLHPLVALPTPAIGAARLRGAWFAVAGDPEARRIVDALEGRPVEVPEDRRVLHHAAAVVAANHLVALLGQVERLTSLVGTPLAAYLALAEGSLEDVRRLGAAAALTGPVRRGDLDTVRRHLAALPADERDLYRALVAAASRLVPEP